MGSPSRSGGDIPRSAPSIPGTDGRVRGGQEHGRGSQSPRGCQGEGVKAQGGGLRYHGMLRGGKDPRHR